MKNFIYPPVILFLFIFSIGHSMAQAPALIPYQAVARNSSGNLIQNQTVSLRFTIHSGAAAGTIVYQETQSVTTSSLGLFSVNIGQGIPNSMYGPFSAINWAASSQFAQVEIDINGGTAYIDMGTQQMLSVPYALYAENAGHSIGSVTYAGTWDASSNTPNLMSSTGTKGSYYVVINSGNHDLNGVSDWNVGDWAIYNGTVWQKVDNSESPTTATEVSYSPTSGISATNVQDAIEELSNDASDPSNITQDATHRFVTDAEKTSWNNKADKIVPASIGNFAALDGSGNLTDGGLKTASNIGFVTTPDISATNVQDAIQEVNGQFADLIDSYIHRNDDGVSIYLPPGGTRKRFGIGDLQPDAPLGIIGETGADDQMISLKSADGTNKWNINLNPTSSNVPGFSIDDVSTGLASSRLFIDHVNQGNVGIGTVTPNKKLSLSGNEDNGDVSLGIVNTATGHSGWSLGHLDDNLVTERNGAFSIIESSVSGALERITILPTKNVGINEKEPDATLHVTRPTSDPQADLALSENTGILLLGPIDNKNLAFDSHQIQARTGSYAGGGTTLSFTATSLELQPLGGDILIHNDLVSDERVIITGNGQVGLGKTPAEKLEVNGAIVVGDSYNTTPSNGTIRYTGSDFEGRKAGNWVSLTADRTFEEGAPGTIYYTPASGNPKVGIGITAPSSSLHIAENYTVSADAVSTRIESNTSTTSVSADDHRIGLQVTSSGSWGSNTMSKNIGIYVKEVSGKSNHEANLAAVLNGNTVIGDLVAGNSVVGTGGRNVLAIQNGDAPSSQAGSSLLTDGGIQIYSQTDAIGTSVFTLMNGDGSVIKLYRSPALTAANTASLSTVSYGTNEATIIENMRTRINQLETRLQALGILQ